MAGDGATFFFDTNIEDVVGRVTSGLSELRSSLGGKLGGGVSTGLENIDQDLVPGLQKAQRAFGELQEKVRGGLKGVNLTKEAQGLADGLQRDVARYAKQKGLSLDVALQISDKYVKPFIAHLKQELHAATADLALPGIHNLRLSAGSRRIENRTKNVLEREFSSGTDTGSADKAVKENRQRQAKSSASSADASQAQAKADQAAADSARQAARSEKERAQASAQAAATARKSATDQAAAYARAHQAGALASRQRDAIARLGNPAQARLAASLQDPDGPNSVRQAYPKLHELLGPGSLDPDEIGRRPDIRNGPTNVAEYQAIAAKMLSELEAVERDLVAQEQQTKLSASEAAKVAEATRQATASQQAINASLEQEKGARQKSAQGSKEDASASGASGGSGGRGTPPPPPAAGSPDDFDPDRLFGDLLHDFAQQFHGDDFVGSPDIKGTGGGRQKRGGAFTAEEIEDQKANREFLTAEDDINRLAEGVVRITDRFVADTRDGITRIYQQTQHGFYEIDESTTKLLSALEKLGSRQETLANRARIQASRADNDTKRDAKTLTKSQTEQKAAEGLAHLTDASGAFAGGPDEIKRITDRFVADLRGDTIRIFEKIKTDLGVGYVELERGNADLALQLRKLGDQLEAQAAKLRAPADRLARQEATAATKRENDRLAAEQKRNQRALAAAEATDAKLRGLQAVYDAQAIERERRRRERLNNSFSNNLEGLTTLTRTPQEARQNQEDLSRGSKEPGAFAQGVDPIGGAGGNYVADIRSGQERIFKRVKSGFAEIEKGSAEFEAQIRRLRAQQEARNRPGITGSFAQGFFSGGIFGDGNKPKGLSGQLEGLSRSAGTTAKYAILGQSLFALQQAFTAAGAEILDFEDSVTELNVALEAVNPSLHSNQDTINQLADSASTAGSNVGEAMDLAAAAVRAFGDTTDGSQRQLDQLQVNFASTASKLATISKTDIADAAGNLRAIGQAFDIPDESFNRILDVIAGAKQLGGGQEKEIGQGLANVGVAFKEIGFNIEETGAIISKIQAETDQGGTLIASRLSRISSIIGGSAGKGAILDLNRQLSPDKQINTTANVKTQVQQLSAVYKDLNEAQKQQLINSLGGTANARELIILLENANSLISAADKGFTGKGVDEFQKRLADIRATLTQIQGNLKNIIAAFANTGILDPFFALAKEALLPALVAVRKILETFDLIPRPLRTIAFTLGEIALAIKLIRSLSKGGFSLGNVFGNAADKVAPGYQLKKEQLAQVRKQQAAAGRKEAEAASKRSTLEEGSSPLAGRGGETFEEQENRRQSRRRAEFRNANAQSALDVEVPPDPLDYKRTEAQRAARERRVRRRAARRQAQARGQFDLFNQGPDVDPQGSLFDLDNIDTEPANRKRRPQQRRGRRRIVGTNLTSLSSGKDLSNALLGTNFKNVSGEIGKGLAARGRDIGGSIGDGFTRSLNNRRNRINAFEGSGGRGKVYADERAAGATRRSAAGRALAADLGAYGPKALTAPAGAFKSLAGALGPEALIGAGVSAVIAANAKTRELQGLTQESDTLRGATVGDDADSLDDAAKNLSSAADDMHNAASGIVGTFTNKVLTLFTGFNVAKDSEKRDKDLAEVFSSSAEILNRATALRKSGDLAGQIDVSSTDSLSNSLDALEAAGYTATERMAALAQKIKDVGNAAAGQSGPLSEADVVGAAGVTTKAAGVAASNAINLAQDRFRQQGTSDDGRGALPYANLDPSTVGKAVGKVGADFLRAGGDVNNRDAYRALVKQYQQSFVKAGLSQEDADLAALQAANATRQEVNKLTGAAAVANLTELYKNLGAGLAAVGQEAALNYAQGQSPDAVSPEDAGLRGRISTNRIATAASRAKDGTYQSSALIAGQAQQKFLKDTIDSTKKNIADLYAAGDPKSISEAHTLEQGLKQAQQSLLQTNQDVAEAAVANLRANYDLLAASRPEENLLGNLQDDLKEIDKELKKADLSPQTQQNLEKERAEKIQAIAKQKRADRDSAERAKVDPNDQLGNADLDVTQARREYERLLNSRVKGQELTDAQRRLNEAELGGRKLHGQYALALANVFVLGDNSTQAANRQLLTATAALEAAKGDAIATAEAQAAYNAALSAQADAALNVASLARQASIDLTNPVSVAREALQTARDKQESDLASDAFKNATPQEQLETKLKDSLAVRNAQASEEQASYTQYISAIDTANSLGTISHKAYMSLLTNKRDQLIAERNLLDPNSNLYQQVTDQINDTNGKIKSLNSDLNGMFNIGDIKLPTAYEVRRAIAGGAGDVARNNSSMSTAGNVTNDASTRNVILNGVPINTVLSIIQDLFGVKVRSNVAKKIPA